MGSISGVVITPCDSDARRRDRLIARLASEPRVEVGPCAQEKIPAVIEAVDGSDARRTVERIEAWEDVLKVDVVFAAVDDGAADTVTSCGAHAGSEGCRAH